MHLEPEHKKIIITLVVLVLAWQFYSFFTSQPKNTTPVVANPLLSPKIKHNIVVYIAGEVSREGVYKVKKDSRVMDLIELAGGVTAYADLNPLNLAEELKDGQKVFIPKIKVAGSSGAGEQTVNVNLASKAELQSVPGLGPSMAARIFEYREKNGSFSRLEELMRVKGMGKGKFAKIRKYLRIS